MGLACPDDRRPHPCTAGSIAPTWLRGVPSSRDPHRRLLRPALADAGRLLSSGRWGEARAAYEAALAREESPQAWDGLGWAAFWLSDEAATLRAREARLRGYRAAGDPRAAGAVAGWLAERLSRVPRRAGDRARVAGARAPAARPAPRGPRARLAGAQRGLARAGRDRRRRGGGPARRARRAHRARAPRARHRGRRAGAAGHRGGHRRAGRPTACGCSTRRRSWRPGSTCRYPLSQGWALCYLITACDGVGDFPRAAQWCQVMRDVSEHWDSRQLVGVCRASYGRVLATSGDWARADVELVAAVGELEAARPAQAPRGLARLGELRARQGRADEARELLTRAGSDGVLGLGELALDAGDADGAADAAERVLRAPPRRRAAHADARAGAARPRPRRAAARRRGAGGVRGARARRRSPRHVVRARPRPARGRPGRVRARRPRRGALRRRGRRRPPGRRRCAVRRRRRPARAGPRAGGPGPGRRRRGRGALRARRVRLAGRRPRAGARRGAARARPRRASPPPPPSRRPRSSRPTSASSAPARSRSCGSSRRASATPRSPCGSCSARTRCTATWRTSAPSSGCPRAPPPWPMPRAPVSFRSSPSAPGRARPARGQGPRPIA